MITADGFISRIFWIYWCINAPRVSVATPFHLNAGAAADLLIRDKIAGWVFALEILSFLRPAPLLLEAAHD